MKILHQYTLRSLKLNKTRTVVTIIGIILSVALFTAVTEGAYSGQQYIVNIIKEQTGSFHLLCRDISATDLDMLQEDDEVDAVGYYDSVGCAASAGDQTYIHVAAVSDNFAQLVSVPLSQGRMPETAQEILLPEDFCEWGGISAALGDTITLKLGTREWNGERLNPSDDYMHGETLTDTVEKTYTVVGFYERMDSLVEGYEAPGFLALTGGSGSGDFTAFLTLDNPRNTYDYVWAHSELNATVNYDLVMAYGGTKNVAVYQMLYGMMAILLVLIVFGSISLIYNSFSISVSERTKQFGLLKSIGATKRQIRGMVLYEALSLCVLAIPLGLLLGCGGIGITLYCLRGHFSSFLYGLSSGNVQIHLVIGVWPLVLAAGIGLITALISAWLPARRAVRLPAIEAIRQSQDVKIRGRQVRTGRLTQKLFGFSGMLAAKNYKRSRRKHRATVISLTLSIVLFVSASAFSMYLRESVNGSYDPKEYDLSYYTAGEERENPDEVLSLLMGADGVTDGVYLDSLSGVDIYANRDILSDTYLTNEYLRPDGEEGEVAVSLSLCFVEDAVFLRLLEEAGQNAETYFDQEHPTALLYNNTKTRIYVEDGSFALEYETFDHTRLPAQVELVTVEAPEDSASWSDYYNDAGEHIYLFYNSDGDEMQAYSASEVERRVPIQIGAVLSEKPFFLSSDAALLFPYSMADQIGEFGFYEDEFYFTSADHAKTYEHMQELLSQAQMSTGRLWDVSADVQATKAVITVVDVFSYGFIILISLIAAANVFNTVSTNILLRRREFAMLKSVGMTQRDFRRMMNYECLLYGLKSLAYGLPISLGFTWLIYKAVANAYYTAFHLPWLQVGIAVLSVFLVVFVTMLYAMKKIGKDNLIDALKEENL